MPSSKKKAGDTTVSSAADDDATTPENVAVTDDPQPAATAAAEAPAAGAAESAPVTVIRTERHYGATDVFGYHLEIPGGFIEVEYLSDGSVRSADGAHPLDAAVFTRPPAQE